MPDLYPDRQHPQVTGYVSIRCPECGCERADEVSEGHMYQELTGFYNRWPEWGDQHMDDMSVIRIVCWDCGFTFLSESDPHPNDLFEYFKERGWLNLPREEGDTNDVSWEV